MAELSTAFDETVGIALAKPRPLVAFKQDIRTKDKYISEIFDVPDSAEKVLVRLVHKNFDKFEGKSIVQVSVYDNYHKNEKWNLLFGFGLCGGSYKTPGYVERKLKCWNTNTRQVKIETDVELDGLEFSIEVEFK